MGVDDMRFRNRLQYPSCRNGGIFGLLDILKKNDEFIASLATNRVWGTYSLLQAICDGLKQLVAC